MKKYLLFFTATILSMLATSCDGKFTSTIVVENSSKAESKKKSMKPAAKETRLNSGTATQFCFPGTEKL